MLLRGRHRAARAGVAHAAPEEELRALRAGRCHCLPGVPGLPGVRSAASHRLLGRAGGPGPRKHQRMAPGVLPAGGPLHHPDHGGVVASHRGRGHYNGVALDLGANSATSGSYTQDQKNLWPYISRFLNKYGLHKDPYVPQVIHGPGESFSPKAASSFADGAHHNHFHVEFHKGGLVGGAGEVPAVLKSGEIVIDTDSSQYGPVKNMLLAVNQATGREGVLKAIQDFASYEQGAGQTVMVQQDEGVQEVPQGAYGEMPTTSKAPPMIIDMSNSFEFLEYQG